jgi:hypothetical protein
MATTVTVTLSEAEKDRRTRMVKSSFKAPMKKEGGGGSFVWGTRTDVTDYLPVGLGSVSKVSVDKPVRLSEVQVAAQTAQYHLKDHKEFPDLAGRVRTVPVKWGPPVRHPPEPAQLKEDALRPGVHEFLGAQHPRNTFARKVRTHPEKLEEELPIDWSKSGTSAFVQALCHEAASSKAHLSPYFEPRANPPTVHHVKQTSPVLHEVPPKATKAFGKQHFRQAPGKVLQARAR